MKKCIVFMAVLAFLSCAVEKDEMSANREKGLMGEIPKSHALYHDMHFNKDVYDLDDLDRSYRQNIQNDTGNDYSDNLKNEAFRMLMDKGLASHGSQEQKKFYISEMMGLNTNVPNLLQFYYLLLSCEEFMTREAMKNIADRFYAKNRNMIGISHWEDGTIDTYPALLLENAYADFVTKWALPGLIKKNPKTHTPAGSK